MFDILKCWNCGKSINIKDTKEYKNEIEGINQRIKYYSQIIEIHKTKISEIELLLEKENIETNSQLKLFLAELKNETIYFEELIGELNFYRKFLKGE